MRHVIAAFIIIASLVGPAWAALPNGGEFSSMDGGRPHVGAMDAKR